MSSDNGIKDGSLKIKGFNPEKYAAAMRNYPIINDMKVGQSGYVGPWVLFLTKEGDLYLNKNITLNDISKNFKVQVERVSMSPDGYVVDFGLLGTREYTKISHVESIDDYLQTLHLDERKNVVKIHNLRKVLTPEKRPTEPEPKDVKDLKDSTTFD